MITVLVESGGQTQLHTLDQTYDIGIIQMAIEGEEVGDT
jgi:hypothetical protein